MAGILDILGQSPATSLSPAGGYRTTAPTAPVPGASSTGSNPFGSALLASDAPGLLGILGRLSGNPTTDEIVMKRLGGQQAQGLAGLQQRINNGMTPQQAIVDFIGSPEGQQFFGSSQDPMGAIKGYLQLSQKPADKFGTISPGQAVFNETTGQIGTTQPTTEMQNADAFAKLADLDGPQAREFGKAMVAKMGAPQNPTQKEDAVSWLIANKVIDETTGKKMLAGVIQVNQPRDAAGNPLGPPIAIDLSQMIQTGNPQDVRMVPVGGRNGGPAGDQPDGTAIDPATGQRIKPSGDIIFGAGPVANIARGAGSVLGPLDPAHLSAPKYNDYQIKLATIFQDVSNLFNVNRQLAAEMKQYATMTDKSGLFGSPIDQGLALQNLLDVTEARIAYNSMVINSTDPKYVGKAKANASEELAALQQLQQDLPDRQSLADAMVRAYAGEGSYASGIKEGASHVGEAVAGAKKTLDAATEAATTTEKAVEPAVAPSETSDANAQPTFKNAQEATAAAKAGKIKEGDTIIIDGQPVIVRRNRK